jgi:hypothetical protein
MSSLRQLAFSLASLVVVFLSFSLSAVAQKKAPDPAEIEKVRKAVEKKLPGDEKTYYALALVTADVNSFGFFDALATVLTGGLYLPLRVLGESANGSSSAGAKPGDNVRIRAVEIVTVKGKSAATQLVMKHAQATPGGWHLIGAKTEKSAADRVADAYEKKLQNAAKKNGVPLDITRRWGSEPKKP